MRNRLIISRPGGEWSPCQGRGRWPEAGPDLQPFRWPEAGPLPARAGSPAFPGGQRPDSQGRIAILSRGQRPATPPAFPGGETSPKPHLPGGQRPDSQGRTPVFPVARGRPHRQPSPEARGRGEPSPKNLIFPVARGQVLAGPWPEAGQPGPDRQPRPQPTTSPKPHFPGGQRPAPAGFRRGRGEHRKP